MAATKTNICTLCKKQYDRNAKVYISSTLCAKCEKSDIHMKNFVLMKKPFTLVIMGEHGTWRTVYEESYGNWNINPSNLVGFISNITGIFFIGSVLKNYESHVLMRTSRRNSISENLVPFSEFVCRFQMSVW